MKQFVQHSIDKKISFCEFSRFLRPGGMYFTFHASNVESTLLAVYYRTLQIHSSSFLMIKSHLLKSIVQSHVSRTREFHRRRDSLRKICRRAAIGRWCKRARSIKRMKRCKKIKALCCTQVRVSALQIHRRQSLFRRPVIRLQATRDTMRGIPECSKSVGIIWYALSNNAYRTCL